MPPTDPANDPDRPPEVRYDLAGNPLPPLSDGKAAPEVPKPAAPRQPYPEPRQVYTPPHAHSTPHAHPTPPAPDPSVPGQPKKAGGLGAALRGLLKRGKSG